jgi:multiple sugar transport system ATP-binding protein/alpha-glucoside transport system ATP-binding protein
MNIMPVKIETAGAHTVITHSNGQRATLPILTPAGAAGSSISLGVRPEDLELATTGDALLEGTIDYVEQLGEVQLAYVDAGRGGEPLVVKLPGDAELKRGATIRLSARPQDLHLFDAEGRSFARERLAEAA